MTISFKPWPHKLPMGTRAMYEVWLDGTHIGVIKHLKVMRRVETSRWDRRIGRSVKVSMRVRRVVWIAQGHQAPGPFETYTRQASAEWLAEEHLKAVARKTPHPFTPEDPDSKWSACATCGRGSLTTIHHEEKATDQ